MEKVVVACHRNIIVLAQQKQVNAQSISYEGTCAAIHPNGKSVAVGGHDSKVRIYELAENGQLSEKKVLAHQGAISSVNYSPDGSHLVATDIVRKVVPYDVGADYKIAAEKEWSYHTARVNCSAWSPNGRYVATGGLDTNIIVWDLKNSGEHPVIIRGAHPMSPVNNIAWLSDSRLITAGQDSNLKQWTMKFGN